MLALELNLWPRFFFFAMGFGTIVVVRGARIVPRLIAERLVGPARARERGTVAGYALLLLLGIGSALTLPRAYGPKQDFSGAREFVERLRGPSDVVVVGLAATAYNRHYAPTWKLASSADELREIVRRQPTPWLVYTLPIQLKARSPVLWEAIEGDYEVVRVFPGTLGGGEIYVCRRRDPGTASNTRREAP